MIYIAYAVTIATIIGTVANSFGKRWCFPIWMCTNGFWCVYNIGITQYAQALLYAFNFAMAIVGLFVWKRRKGANKIQDSQKHMYDYSRRITKASIGRRIIFSWVAVASIFFFFGLGIGIQFL